MQMSLPFYMCRNWGTEMLGHISEREVEKLSSEHNQYSVLYCPHYRCTCRSVTRKTVSAFCLKCAHKNTGIQTPHLTRCTQKSCIIDNLISWGNQDTEKVQALPGISASECRMEALSIISDWQAHSDLLVSAVCCPSLYSLHPPTHLCLSKNMYFGSSLWKWYLSCFLL